MRKLAAILFADIVGYTALMGRDEKAALRAISQFKEIAAPLIEQHGGTWHKDLGDGALCSFDSALNATHAAIAIQKKLKEKAAFAVRIGLHQGEVTLQDGDIFGDGVNVASRLQAEAAPGGICLSDAIYRNIRNKDGILARSMGKQRLKNVQEPLQLFQIIEEGVGQRSRTEYQRAINWKWFLVALGIVAAASSLITWNLKKASSIPATASVNLSLEIPDMMELSFPNHQQIALSPSGRYLAYSGAEQVRLVDLEEMTAARTVTQEFSRSPVFSPDGQWLMVDRVRHMLVKVPVKGGPVEEIFQSKVSYTGFNWATPNSFFFGNVESGLWQLDPVTKETKQIAEPDTAIQEVLKTPWLLPDEKTLIYTSQFQQNGEVSSRIMLLSLDKQQRRTLVEKGSTARYLPSGHLVFEYDNNLYAAPFDLKQKTLKEAPRLIQPNIKAESGMAQYAFSQTGLFVFARPETGDKSKMILASISPGGSFSKFIPESFNIDAFSLSPDGRHIALSLQEYGMVDVIRDIWIYQRDRQTLDRLTTNIYAYAPILWAPDGSQVYFNQRTANDERWQLIAKSLNPGHPGVPIWTSNYRPVAINRQEEKIIATSFSDNMNDIVRFNLRDSSIFQLTNLPSDQIWPALSPDESWLAYGSDETGDYEVYLMDPNDPATRIRVSRDGGGMPQWASNGKKLYFLKYQSFPLKYSVMEVSIQTNPVLEIGLPKMVIENIYSNREFTIDPLTGHFVVMLPEERWNALQGDGDVQPTKLYFTLNWFDKVRKLAGE